MQKYLYTGCRKNLTPTVFRHYFHNHQATSEANSSVVIADAPIV